MGVSQHAQNLSLATEAGQKLGPLAGLNIHYFDREASGQAGVRRDIHLGHASRSEQALDAIGVVDDLAGR